VVWVIGTMAQGSLPEFKCQGFIYQPNARHVDLNLDRDRLMADVDSQCYFGPG
jgi:hypothetical protein